MADFWASAEGGKLVFGYRARHYGTSPPRFLTSTELTAVLATAYDEYGSPIVVSQQPSYVASLGGYVGWITATDLAGRTFVSLQMAPAVGVGIPAAWAPAKSEDVRIDYQLASLVPTNLTIIAD